MRKNGKRLYDICQIWLSHVQFFFDKHVQLAQNSWINSVLDRTIPEIDQPKRNASFWANYSHLSRGYLQWSFSRESHQKYLNLGLGIIVICPVFEHQPL